MLEERTLTLISLALIAFGVWWLMPRRNLRTKWIGFPAILLGGLGQISVLRIPENPIVNEALFWFFSCSAILCAIVMITGRNPVYSALWFALSTLSICGLFLLQSAPFLAAATIIVYAGAIVVTFVFVIMLAQQSGTAIYDQRSRQSGLAIISAFVMLGAILTALTHSSANLVPPSEEAIAAIQIDQVTTPNPFSHPREAEKLGTLHGMGRSLFGDYLYAVELAGVLLMVASIGAIAIAPRRGQGTL